MDKLSSQGIEVADLDALIDTPLTFKLHGKVRTLEPIRNITFLRFVTGLNKLYKDVEDKTIDGLSFQETVLELFRVVCPEISTEDIQKCTQPQIAALFSLIVDHINGRVGSDKKKIALH